MPQGLFTKHRPGAPPAYYRLEAAGLRWLADAGVAAIPQIVEVAEDRLVLRQVDRQGPTRADAARFGVELAGTHRAGATAYGCPPPDSSSATPASGYIADLPLPFGSWLTFGHFYARARIEPFLQRIDAHLDEQQRAAFAALIERLLSEDERIVGHAEPPSRIHGDLWSGNVVWGPDPSGATRGWLIDPAAHGGHRETDLAMLALFGAPHLAVILAAYDAEYPLCPGWQQRVALHQVHPLLVHAALFGGGYLTQAVAAASATLRL